MRSRHQTGHALIDYICENFVTETGVFRSEYYDQITKSLRVLDVLLNAPHNRGLRNENSTHL